MAFHDTLFQLGMDLTRSSTAQKEDISCVECDVDGDRGTSAEPLANGRTPSGTLHIIELSGLRISDRASLERALKRAADALGLKPRMLRSAEIMCAAGGGTLSAAVQANTGTVTVEMQGVAGITPAAATIALAGTFGAREAVLRKACMAPVRMLKPAGVKRATPRAELRAA